ncbi:MAG: heavy metal translocating P-type ATPase, partial [Patescibacteria group bacterium]
MFTKKTFNIRGMHCASCSLTIERALKKMDGVESVEVNYGTEKAKIQFDASKVDVSKLSSTIEPLGYTLQEEESKSRSMQMTAQEMGMSENEHAEHLGLNQTKKEKLAELHKMRNMVWSAIPLALFSLVLMTWELLIQIRIVSEMPIVLEEFFHHLLPIFATYILFVVGKPYLVGLYRFLRYGKANMDTLIGLGTLAAFLYSFIVTAFEETLRPFLDVDVTYYDVTIVVISFIALGKYLEMRSKLKTGDAIEALLTLQAKTALVVRDGKEIELPLDQVVHGDILIVKPAGKIPVDGVILEGSSFVDEAMITGEPIPVEKKTDDHVIAGTINTTGSFTMKATRIGSETMLARIIKMVEDAQGSKAPIQALADKISGVFVPIVLVIAFVSLVLWIVIGTKAIGFSQALSFGLTCFVGVLVIACPCALGLATPTAIIVGVGKGAREGILVKNAATLEKLHKVNVVVVDKTGTITKGKPEVIDVFPLLAK